MPQIAEFFDSAHKVAENRESVTYTGDVDGIQGLVHCQVFVQHILIFTEPSAADTAQVALLQGLEHSDQWEALSPPHLVLQDVGGKWVQK